MSDLALSIRGVSKRYAEHTAVRDLSLSDTFEDFLTIPAYRLIA